MLGEQRRECDLKLLPRQIATVEVGFILDVLAAPLPLLRDVLMLERLAVVQHPLHVLMVGEDDGSSEILARRSPSRRPKA